jgi:hypothetical protein
MFSAYARSLPSTAIAFKNPHPVAHASACRDGIHAGIWSSCRHLEFMPASGVHAGIWSSCRHLEFMTASGVHAGIFPAFRGNLGSR